jgi:hypothetical protein
MRMFVYAGRNRRSCLLPGAMGAHVHRTHTMIIGRTPARCSIFVCILIPRSSFSVVVCRSLFHQDYSVDVPEGEDVATLLCGVTPIEQEAGTSVRGTRVELFW